MNTTRQAPTACLRGSPEWTGWVKRLAHQCRMPVSVLIDLALLGYAKQNGFELPPPRWPEPSRPAA